MSAQQVTADLIRRFANDHYVEPARSRREPTVTIHVAEIHDRLGLHQRAPQVCAALAAAAFEDEYRVRQARWDGPKQGRSTRITFAVLR